MARAASFWLSLGVGTGGAGIRLCSSFSSPCASATNAGGASVVVGETSRLFVCPNWSTSSPSVCFPSAVPRLVESAQAIRGKDVRAYVEAGGVPAGAEVESSETRALSRCFLLNETKSNECFGGLCDHCTAAICISIVQPLHIHWRAVTAFSPVTQIGSSFDWEDSKEWGTS